MLSVIKKSSDKMKKIIALIVTIWSFCSGAINAQINPVGTFCFGSPNLIGANHLYSRSHAIDFDGDFDMDIVVYDKSTFELKVFLNNGLGLFPSSLTQTISTVADITVGDLAGNYLPDIAVLQNNGIVQLFKNTSATSLPAMVSYTTIMPPTTGATITTAASIDAINYNSDAYIDLFITYFYQPSTQVFGRYCGLTNNGLGGFNLETMIGNIGGGNALSTSYGIKASFGYTNADFFLDAAFSYSTSTNTSTEAQETNASSLFTTTGINPTNLTLAVSPITDMRIENYDGLGNADVGVFSKGNGFFVFNSPLTNTIQSIPAVNPLIQGSKYLWKDLNNDLNNEFITLNSPGGAIYINKGMTGNLQFGTTLYTYSDPSTTAGNMANFVVEDFDGNGLKDILISGDYSSTGELRLIKNYSYTFKTTSNHGGIICGASPVTLSVQSYSNISASYAWNTLPSQTTATASVNAPNTYSTIVNFIPEAGATCSINSLPLAITYINSSLPSFTPTPQSNPFCVKVSGETIATFSVSGVPSYTLFSSFGVTPNALTINPRLGINTYTVDGQDSLNGCVNTHTFSVLGIQGPMYPFISASNINTITCAGSPVTLTVTCDSTKNYLWLPSSLTSSVITVNPTSSTNYTAFVSNGVCKDSATYFVNVTPTPIINASISSTNICTNQGGAVVNFSGTIGNTYYTSNGSNTYTASSLILTPTSTVIYTVIVTNASFVCSKDSTFKINVNITPTVNVSPQTTTVCAYYSTTLTANGADHYIWSNGATTQSTVVNPYLSVTIYTVTGQDVTSLCSDSKTITIYTKPLPIITASTNSTQICSGSLAVLQAGGGTTYSWSPVGIISQNVSVFPTTNTTYTVYGMGTNGCANFATVAVGVYPAQNINAYATPSAICVGESATLSVNGGTPTVGNYQNEIVAPTINTSYSVTIIDNNGCLYDRTAYVEVNVTCATLVYNGFTPNGDGVNDLFYIDHIDHFTNNKVSIYNRWGNSVFETTNYNNLSNAWDGRVKGVVVPNGTYFYVINLNDGSEPKKGWVEVTGQ